MRRDLLRVTSFLLLLFYVISQVTQATIDAIRKMDDSSVESIVSPSSGVHLILPKYYCPSGMGLIDPSTSDGRVIFFLPWENSVIAGTTG